MVRELSASELRWQCPGEWITAASTSEISPSTGIIGQARAVRALEFGLAIDSLGFNVFVTGLTGTGRMTAIELHLRPVAAAGAVPDDLLYVYNFDRAEHPRLLRLSAGRGGVLKEGLERLVREFAGNLPGLFEGEEFQQRLELALEDLKAKQQEMLRSFEKRVRDAGFTLVQVQVGSVTRPEILPLVDERPVTLEKLQSLAEEGKFARDALVRLEEQHGKLSEELQRVFHEVMEVREQMMARADELRRATVEPLLEGAMQEIAREVGDERAAPYLAEVRKDVLEHLDTLGGPGQDGDGGDPLLRYRINLVVDNRATQGRPVVIETEPNFSSLFGTVEARVAKDWQATSDHTRIRAGSLLRANGGFLVVNAFDLVSEAGVWPALKRALRYRRVFIQPRDLMFALSGHALKPEPVDLDVKVIMVGDRALYDLLHELDEEFRKIFKVLADFDSEMPNGHEQVADFLALVEESVRLARNRRRLSARFSDVADILRESAFLARQGNRATIGAAEIRASVQARRDRHCLPEEKLTEYMLDDVLHVATEGARVGQVNGLAVYDLGYHSFGLPGRVTASVAVGRQGVINVEREARMSGRTHDKGVLILGGFLRGTFAGEQPLSMTASIAFEQSYSGIDGDSASSTEVYAILSALAALPLRQDLAVTGSVDQHGRIQAIGGVNEKIEGFFSLCSRRGLTGSQGVLIPAVNVADLQLEPEVVAAVGAGRFHIYPVRTVAEGIELLSGEPAGERDGATGGYPAATVFGRCAARLAAMGDQLRKHRSS